MSGKSSPDDTAPKPDREKPADEKTPIAWAVPAITVALLGAAFLIYYFVYVGARREYLANRNFRALALLGEQLQQSVSVHGNILNSCARLLSSKKQAAHVHKSESGLFLLVHHEDEDLADAEKEQEALKDYLKFLAPSFELSEISQETSTGTRVERRNGRWELVLRTFQGGSGKNRNTYQGSLKINELMKPLVASLPFDDVLLVSQDGFIVYHSQQTGPQFTTLSSLLQAQTGTADRQDGKSGGELRKADAAADAKIVNQNSDPAWRSRSMHLTDLVLAGTRYKLFLQPVLVSSFADKDDSRTEPASEFVLCGLQSATALEWEALSLSYTFFIWLTVAFFVIWTSFKALKILFLNHRENLRLRELGTLGVSLVLLTSVLTFSLLQLAFRRNDDTEAQLGHLSRRISANIEAELGRMRAQLGQWCESDALQGPRGDLSRLARSTKTEMIRNADPTGRPIRGAPLAATPKPDIYPFASNVFWTDDDGHQIVKWSTTQYVTPMISVSELPFFAHPAAIKFRGDSRDFEFASILPPNKLEYLAVLGLNTTDCLMTLPGGGFAGIKGDSEIANGRAFLAAQPLSLVDPILPYGYGFTVVDNTGGVLFHSEKIRNGRENFLMESGSKELHAAIFGHASPHSIAIKYQGHDYQALVTPMGNLSQMPWSLIVFRDLTGFRTLDLQVMTLASTLLFVVLAGPVIFISIRLWSLRLRFAPEWLWPNRGRMDTYLHQVYWYALLILSFLFVNVWASTEIILIACLALPYLAFVTTWWCFRVYRPAEPKSHTWGQIVAAKAAAGLSILGAIAVACSTGDPKVLGAAVMGFPRPGNRRDSAAVQSDAPRPGESVARGDADAAGQPVAYRTAYLVAALLLLLLFGVLMPMVLFRASLDFERRLSLKQSQLHMASAVSQRWTAMARQNENTEISATAWDWYRHRSPEHEDPWRWIVPENLTRKPDLRVEPHRPAQKEHFAGWLRSALYLLHHDYNDASAEMLGVLQDSGNPSDWSWDNEGSMLTLRWHGPHRDANPSSNLSRSHDDLLIASAIPAFSRADALVYSGIGLLVILSVGGLLLALARKIFLFGMAPLKISGARQVAEALRKGRNVLVLVPPVSDWKLEVPRKTIDVSALATAMEWDHALADIFSTPERMLIELRHFEFRADASAIESRKFLALETLLGREATQVVVVMKVPASSEDYGRRFPTLETIDLRDEPFSWLKQYEGPAQELIWQECGPLPALWPLGAQLAADLKAETAPTADTVASEILERADAYYRMIWNECSKDQRFVLSQLASDGLLNPTNGRAIRQMIRRGLITQDPQFRIVNESFRRFLRSTTSAQLKREWLNESRRSGWGRAHGAFFTGMTLFGIFLLATQNALWQSAAAYVTTALGGLGTLSKLLESLRGKMSPEKG